MKTKLFLLFKGEEYLTQILYRYSEENRHNDKLPYPDDDSIFTIEFDYYKEDARWFHSDFASASEFQRSFSVSKLLLSYFIDDDWSFTNN